MPGFQAIGAMGQQLINHGTVDPSISLEQLNQLYNKGWHLLEARLFHQALTYFEVVATLSPLHSHALLALSICCYETLESERAKRLFEVLEFLNFQHPLFTLYRVYLLIDQKNLTEAKTLAAQGVLLFQNDPSLGPKLKTLYDRLIDEN
jgi:hypothetical protein